MGEHLPYKQGVTGSSPVLPTTSGDFAKVAKEKSCNKTQLFFLFLSRLCRLFVSQYRKSKLRSAPLRSAYRPRTDEPLRVYRNKIQFVVASLHPTYVSCAKHRFFAFTTRVTHLKNDATSLVTVMRHFYGTSMIADILSLLVGKCVLAMFQNLTPTQADCRTMNLLLKTAKYPNDLLQKYVAFHDSCHY